MPQIKPAVFLLIALNGTAHLQGGSERGHGVVSCLLKDIQSVVIRVTLHNESAQPVLYGMLKAGRGYEYGACLVSRRQHLHAALSSSGATL